MKKTIIEIRKMLKVYEETNKELLDLEARFDEEPENEEIEKQWNKIYKQNYNSLELAAEMIVKSTMNMIDVKTARMMIITQKEELETVLSKVA